MKDTKRYWLIFAKIHLIVFVVLYSVCLLYWKYQASTYTGIPYGSEDFLLFPLIPLSFLDYLMRWIPIPYLLSYLIIGDSIGGNIFLAAFIRVGLLGTLQWAFIGWIYGKIKNRNMVEV